MPLSAPLIKSKHRSCLIVSQQKQGAICVLLQYHRIVFFTKYTKGSRVAEKTRFKNAHNITANLTMLMLPISVRSQKKVKKNYYYYSYFTHVHTIQLAVILQTKIVEAVTGARTEVVSYKWA